jgi:C_GCAxxG_C_C family probable redox protein
MQRKEIAAQHFTGGYNCAQSVLALFAGDYGLDQNHAVSLATGFGSGIARLGQVCGAVSGACMVIGLKYGSTPSDEPNFQEQKEKTYLLVSDFAENFKERNRSINCSELIGYDLDDPTQHAEAKRLGVFSTLCTKFVRDAVEITEEILNTSSEEVS